MTYFVCADYQLFIIRQRVFDMQETQDNEKLPDLPTPDTNYLFKVFIYSHHKLSVWVRMHRLARVRY